MLPTLIQRYDKNQRLTEILQALNLLNLSWINIMPIFVEYGAFKLLHGKPYAGDFFFCSIISLHTTYYACSGHYAFD